MLLISKLKTLLLDRHVASSKNDFLLSFIFLASLFFILNRFYTVCFETNDDVLFSMLIHGYGVAKYSTDFLPASNVLISYISRCLPVLFNIPGYVSFSILLLFISCWMIIYCLLRMNIPLMISIFVSILLCLRPILLPQFTVTAGLLAIDGILFVYLYRQNNDGFYLLLAGLFACLSFSLRSQQFFLVLLVSFPLVLSKNLLFRGKFIKFVLFIIVVCLALSVTDYRVKNSPELKEFTQFHYKMAAATDFGYTHKLIESPEILEKYGYTINDIRLMDSYFYVTDKYTDTTSIDKMINEVGFSEKLDVQQGIAALRAFFDPSILPLVFLGFVLIVLLPLSRKQRLVIISILFLISGLFFSIGAIGRPGRLRMYFPIAVVILLCPLILACFDKLKSKNTLLIVSISSFVCCLFAIKYMHDIAIYNTLWSRQVRQDIKNLPVNEPIFSWGAAFPFEAAYPLFGNWQEFQRYDVRLFGGYTSAPFCKETTIFGAGFLDLMHSRNGVLTLEWNRGGCVILKTFAQEWQLGCQIQCEHQGIIRPNRNIIRVQCE